MNQKLPETMGMEFETCRHQLAEAPKSFLNKYTFPANVFSTKNQNASNKNGNN